MLIRRLASLCRSASTCSTLYPTLFPSLLQPRVRLSCVARWPRLVVWMGRPVAPSCPMAEGPVTLSRPLASGGGASPCRRHRLVGAVVSCRRASPYWRGGRAAAPCRQRRLAGAPSGRVAEVALLKSPAASSGRGVCCRVRVCRW